MARQLLNADFGVGEARERDVVGVNEQREGYFTIAIVWTSLPARWGTGMPSELPTTPASYSDTTISGARYVSRRIPPVVHCYY